MQRPGPTADMHVAQEPAVDEAAEPALRSIVGRHARLCGIRPKDWPSVSYAEGPASR